MKPSEIINGCNRDGIHLTLTNDGMIRYKGEGYALNYWLPILAAHKSAVIDDLSADPFADDVDVIQRCEDCLHLTKFGDGYCAQRQDLPPAYGDGHPLRRLPADNGESCREWDAVNFYHQPKGLKNEH